MRLWNVSTVARGPTVRLGSWTFVILALALFVLVNTIWLRLARQDADLIAAVRHRDKSWVLRLLRNGADPNCVYNVSSKTATKQSLLDCLRILITEYDPSRKNGEPLLSLAIGTYDVSRYSYQLPNGATVTGARFVRISEDASIVGLLLDSGANPNSLCGSGESILRRAVRHGSQASVRLLLQHGAEPGAP